MNSILKSTKELLGIPEEIEEFDSQLVLYINMALGVLNQIGVGTPDLYQTTLTDGDLETFLPYDEGMHSLVQMYIYIKVRILFDPPTTSFVLSALNDAVKEYEWRLTDHPSNAPTA